MPEAAPRPAFAAPPGSPPAVILRDLSRTFRQRGGLFGKEEAVYAVRGVSLAVQAGQTLGVVGESGCGKSTLGRMAVGLLPPSSGDVLLEGVSLYDGAGRVTFRGNAGANVAGRVQMIFQDPYSSLNPRMRVGTSVAEPLVCAGKERGPMVRRKVAAMLEQVGLDEDSARRYPHEFSGGQRQRIAIARALITRPAFVVCDEPTSSLDASVQAQVLNLLRDMQEQLGLSYMFISHDLSVVRHMSDRVAVMYRGSIVEEAAAEVLFASPCHPYTRLLVDSVPGVCGPALGACPPPGEHAAPPAAQRFFAGSALASGDCCPFLPRCPHVMEQCGSSLPPFFPHPQEGEKTTGGDSRAAGVRCFLYQQQKDTNLLA